MDKNFDFYIFALPNQVAIADGANVSPEAQIGNEYDLEVTEMRAVIYKLAAPTGPVLVNMKLSGGVLLNENPFDLFAIASQNIQSHSGYPVRIPWIATIPSSSKWSATITNNAGAAVDVQIMFIGRKIFKGR